METLLRFIVIFITSIFITSCGVIECVDSQFEREPVAIEGEYLFDITFDDNRSTFHAIKCEKYYDAICAERGNSWRIREVGKLNAYKRSALPVSSDSNTQYDLILPNCEKMIKLNAQIKMKDLHIVWNKGALKIEKTKTGQVTTSLSKSYHYLSTENGVHRFKYGGYRDVPLEVITLKFSIKLNGKIIE